MMIIMPNKQFVIKEKIPSKDGLQKMSKDRLPTKTESWVLKLFESSLRKWCEEHEGYDTVVITNSEGKNIFEARLLDREG